jgi:hypothetical protein
MNCLLGTNIVSLATAPDARVIAKFLARGKLQVGW